jgi:amidohydrolase
MDLRHDLHRHPEIGFAEHRTSERVQRELSSAGIPFRAGLARGTGVVAHIASGAPRGTPAVALRADMDALPIEERSGLPYASRIGGMMHACGHDGHTSILVGAGRVLAGLAHEGALPHDVLLLFQPAEEGGGGGRLLVEEGCLDGGIIGPPVSRVFGLHGWPWLPLGTAGIKEGVFFAASDRFTITVRGAGTHAAWPHEGRDPVLAASAIVMALQQIPARDRDPTEPVVVTACTFHAGKASNVIPPTAEVSGTIRTVSERTRTMVHARMQDVVAGIAAAHGCDAKCAIDDGFPLLRNDPIACEDVRRAVAACAPRIDAAELANPVMGGEDFSYYAQRVPSCFLALGLQDARHPQMPVLHADTFDFNDAALPYGVELMARLASSRLPEPV